MMTLGEDEWDAYTRFAAPLILARFPDWEDIANLMPRADGEGCALEFNLPCPSPDNARGLWVSTADDELTVGFHTHHRHYSNYEIPLNPEQVDVGIQFADDILEERVGVVSWYRTGEFAGSLSVELPHPGPLLGSFDGFPPGFDVGDIVSGLERATLRSWFGRFDREEAKVASKEASVDGCLETFLETQSRQKE